MKEIEEQEQLFEDAVQHVINAAHYAHAANLFEFVDAWEVLAAAAARCMNSSNNVAVPKTWRAETFAQVMREFLIRESK